ncbi:hypothetical protein B0I35DRAFT_67623 [Stachybotrys elegans]|uniref:DUF7770 domain-containing protein n=1 Tax=Stachybotrys elegans TaxID=80388 RepID=A0A8K0WMZ9_9HYPO|nr:hypothetical protein B0I35DRAFT_67623 [Stachybotrys elegans]
MTSHMDRNWDTDRFDNEDLERRLNHIHFCAYRNEHNEGDEDGNPPTNHWVTSLEISEDHAVILDMAPGYGSDGQRGKIEVWTQRYDHNGQATHADQTVQTNETIHSLSFELNGRLTVQNIVDLITRNGRQRYNFTPEWEGCRYWVYTLSSDLEAQRIIQPGSAAAVWSAVSYYYVNPSGYEVRVLRQGTFRASE